MGVIGEPFTLVIPPSTFVDPQNDPLILSAGLYNSSLSLPGWLNFNPVSNRFSGTPTDSGVLDISVTAADPEGLSTVSEFSLTVRSTPQSAPLIDVKTIASILGTLGTVGLSVLVYLCKVNYFRNKREFQHPFANRIHQRLRLSYPDLLKNNGKEYATVVKQMISLLKEKSGVDIKQLKSSTRPQDQLNYKRYADLFATHIQLRVKIDKVYCGTSQELHLQDLEDRREEIVDAVIVQASQPEEKLQRSSWCGFFCCRRPALIVSDLGSSQEISMSVLKSQDENMFESKSVQQSTVPANLLTGSQISTKESVLGEIWARRPHWDKTWVLVLR